LESIKPVRKEKILESVRIKIANEAADLEIAGFKMKEELAQKELANETLRLKGKEKTAEEEAKLIDLQTKVFVASEEQKTTAAQRQTRINILLAKEALSEEKKIVEEKKQINIDYYKQAEENQKKFIEEFLIGAEKELELLDLQQEKRKEFLEQAGLSELEIQEKFRQERLDVIDKYSAKEIEKAEEVLTTNTELVILSEQEIADARVQIARSSVDALAALSTLFGEQSASAVAFQKVLAGVQIGIDTAVAISKGVASAQSVPFPANLAAIATTVAAVLANVARAKQLLSKSGEVPKPPKFEQGGEVETFADGGRVIPIRGKSHRQGGENVKVGNRTVANIEGGEGMFIMKKTAFSSINKYSNINKAFGGKSWTGGTTKYAADGGQLNATLPASQANNSVNNQIEQANLMADAMRNIPAPELSLTELNKRQSIMSKSIRVSEL
jgi:hypothetical protein